MQLKDISFPTPQENIFYDEILFQLANLQAGSAAGADFETVRFWESSSYFIVLGRLGKAEEDVHLLKTQADQVPLLRRSSGGGTVLQGPGCLNYSLVLSKLNHPVLNDLHASYKWICGTISGVLGDLGVQAAYRPVSDIALINKEMKISGNAQHRGKTYILHHGTLLYNFNLELITRYMAIPKDMPAYRQGRPHQEFVANAVLDPAKFKKALAAAFEATTPSPLTPQESTLLKKYIK